MKLQAKNVVNQVILMAVALLSQVAVFAQDKGLDVNVDVDRGGDAVWYTNPLFIAIGVAVFVLLLVALLRGNQGRTTQ